MTICMSNGGIYENVKIINEIKVEEIGSVKLKDILSKNDFIDIEFSHLSHSSQAKAVLYTKCISSVNFD